MARSSQRFPARSRRTTIWNQGPGQQTVDVVSSSTTLVLGLGQTAFGGTTIIRIRGNFAATLQTAGAAGDGFHMGLGIGISTADAFSVGGVTSLPNPLDDIGWGGWMYHRILDVHTATSSITDGVNAVCSVVQVEVDTKAMRKMLPNETIWASLQLVEDGAASVGVFFDSRMLVKLS